MSPETMPDQVEVTQESERLTDALLDLLDPDCERTHQRPEVLCLVMAAIQKARADALGDAYDKLRGTNADLCKTPGAAYRLMLDTLRSLTESEVSRAE